MIALLKPSTSVADAVAAVVAAKRAALYLRVSTSKQEEDGTSLESQEELCLAYAAEHGYVVEDHHVYHEVYTGVELWDRPKLSLAREALRRGEFDVLIAYAIDRLSRDPVHLGVIVSDAEHLGVAVEFVTEPLDNSPEGQLIRFVRGYAAKVEHAKIRERSLRGRLSRVRAGKVPNAGSDKFGYRRDRDAGVRVLYEPEAALIRRIFVWYVKKKRSISGIVRELNAQGVPTPGSDKRTYKDGRTPHWSNSAIERILTDPAYKGESYAWRRQLHKAGHGQKGSPRLRPPEEWVPLAAGSTPAIVEAWLWDAAQARRAANKGQETRNESSPYLLRGRIRCAVCAERGIERRMSPDMSGPSKRPVYRCASRQGFGGACGSKSIPAADCEAWVWERVTAILEEPSIIAREVEKAREAGPDQTLLKDREATQRAIARIERQREKVVRRFSDTDEDDEDDAALVKRELARLREEKKAHEATLVDIDRRLADAAQAVERLDALHAYCARVKGNLGNATFEDRRTALEALAVEVIGHGRDWLIRGSIPLDDSGVTIGAVSRSS